jgi:hypothetical protein
MLFKLKTKTAHTFKILAEILYNNVKNICLEINKDGIKIHAVNSLRSIFLDIELFSDNFNLYKYKSTETLYVGMCASHFYKMLKSIKKKDSLCLFISDDNIHELGIQVTSSESERTTTSYINITSEQINIIELPSGYIKSNLIQANEFSKMIKDLQMIGKTIQVVKDNFIAFTASIESLFKRTVCFGEEDDSEDEIFKDVYSTELFSNISKISSISKTVHVYVKVSKPLYIKCDIGSLGVMRIFIKCMGDINDDENDLEDD